VTKFLVTETLLRAWDGPIAGPIAAQVGLHAVDMGIWYLRSGRWYKALESFILASEYVGNKAEWGRY
jgi:hypothetical protein